MSSDEVTAAREEDDTVELRPLAGLDVALTAEPVPSLRFGAEVSAPEGERRAAAELGSVLMDPRAARPDDVIYTVYRGVAPPRMADEIKRRGLLYVALVLRPGTLGEEWVRTRGHTNNDARGTHMAYPEVHEVWHGDALLYLQKEAAPDVSDVVVIPLKPGDKAVVAPGWASLLANVGNAPLVVGSWRTSDCEPQIDALAALGGMAHYVLRDGAGGGVGFDTNKRYRSVPVPRRVEPAELPDWGLKRGEPMLTTFHANPDFLRFLLRPQDYADVWAKVYGDDGW